MMLVGTLGREGSDLVLLACQYWVMCAMCSISLLQKIVELSNNVVVC